MAEMKFETSLRRLEQLVMELDQSDLELEARLKKFEEGMKLTRQLNKKLTQAKKKVEVLVKTDSGDNAVTAFDEDGGPDL